MDNLQLIVKKYNIAIVGATGVVGETMLSILEERNFPVNNLILLASERSSGKEYWFRGQRSTVKTLNENSFKDINIALFSAGAMISKQYADIAVSEGCTVIDNSSAFRMDSDVPLVIPEINPEALSNHNGIIANPNCTTIVTLMALNAINKYSKIKKIIASSYQAVSGAGQDGINELIDQNKAIVIGQDPQIKYFSHQIANNLIPKIDRMDENGFTAEEMKMVNETRKIFNDENIRISATCVRVPVKTAHSVAVTIETENKIPIDNVREMIKNAEGVELLDDPLNNIYPMPLLAEGKDSCLVGRIREDLVFENGISLWVSGDQLRKGAALNTIQIAEKMIEMGVI
ncbi:MAG: aspartate-semialdehyde dehydrogenase [Candidatus Delongbacteria bacterium]|nr:aspartate-semialdehyde dehydrogenase [Candidatus Delongbacteria bacterium]